MLVCTLLDALVTLSSAIEHYRAFLLLTLLFPCCSHLYLPLLLYISDQPHSIVIKLVLSWNIADDLGEYSVLFLILLVYFCFVVSIVLCAFNYCCFDRMSFLHSLYPQLFRSSIFSSYIYVAIRDAPAAMSLGPVLTGGSVPFR